MADLELCGDRATGQIRSRRGRAPRRGRHIARLRRLHCLRRRLATIAALYRRASAFARLGRKCSHNAVRRCRPTCAIAERRHRSRRADSGRIGGRRGRRTRFEAISQDRRRHHADHAGDDRWAQCMKPIRVLSVASEVYPLIKTGGLADVVGALPLALQEEAVETRTLVPGYPDVMSRLGAPTLVLEWPVFFGGPTCLLSVSCGELDMLVLDAPHLFARPGNPYVSSDGTDWPDNGLRFAALSRMAAIVGLGVVPSFVPDVVHTHDWQAGLTHGYLHYGHGPRPGRVMTVHNLAYQGRFPRDMLDAFGLPAEAFTLHGVEYYGEIGFLKAGLQFADRITTVSPTYAVEIQTDEGGMGLGGLLRERARDLRGILNGIDINVWNPATDPAIASRFDAKTLNHRPANKSALQKRFNLE